MTTAEGVTLGSSLDRSKSQASAVCSLLWHIFVFKSLAPVCPKDKPLVNCFVAPCSVTTCPRHPNAICIDDYCGGCNARFFVGSREVTRSCGMSFTCMAVE